MFKQKVCGFQGRTLPFTIFIGLFLLTISIYESIYGLDGINIFSYILPGVVLAVIATIIFMLSFVSYEYRLMYNCLIIRKIVCGKTSRAITITLDDQSIGFKTITNVRSVLCMHKMYLPFFKRGERVEMAYKTKSGKTKTLVFQPCTELFAMINSYRAENIARD